MIFEREAFCLNGDLTSFLDFNTLQSRLSKPEPRSQNIHPHNVCLNTIFDTFFASVINSKDRLNSLNASRKQLVERRLETITRTIAINRGERPGRPATLTDLQKFTRNRQTHPERLSTVQAAITSFFAEVALYNVFELFVLKALDFHGWRRFSTPDIRKLNYAVHSFLNERAVGFVSDPHCWNFVRNNVYSWFVPSQESADILIELINKMDQTSPISWSDHDLKTWLKKNSDENCLSHLESTTDETLAHSISRVLQATTGTSFIDKNRNDKSAKKIFIPCSDKGGIALHLLDGLLDNFDSTIAIDDEEPSQDVKSLQSSIWFCETDPINLFLTEVRALLKTLSKTNSDRVATGEQRFRIPQVIHGTNTLALELYNREQTQAPYMHSIKDTYTGTAKEICQSDTFDVALVTDSKSLSKSSAWLQSLAHQLPYWKSLINSATTLNWGELHLALSLGKLKDDGICIYFSHRPLHDGKDGDRLRKSLLNIAKLEVYAEISTDQTAGHLYVFRICSDKSKRDSHVPKFGKLNLLSPDVSPLKESGSMNVEIMQKGWNHLTLEGQTPLFRKLCTKLPKLSLMASVEMHTGQMQTNGSRKKVAESEHLFIDANDRNKNNLLQFVPGRFFCTIHQGKVLFSNILSDEILNSKQNFWVITPHSEKHTSWIMSILSSRLISFWLKATCPDLNDITTQTIRNIPIVDLSNVCTDTVNSETEYLSLLQTNDQSLNEWMEKDQALDAIKTKFTALSTRKHALSRMLERYKPLFIDELACSLGTPTLKLQCVTHFYPERLLTPLKNSNAVKVMYKASGMYSNLQESWIISTVTCKNNAENPTEETTEKTTVEPIINITTKGGPDLDLAVPVGCENYILRQLNGMIGYSWAEVSNLLLIPADAVLFSLQTKEITRVFMNAATEVELYNSLISKSVFKLFDIDATALELLHEIH